MYVKVFNALEKLLFIPPGLFTVSNVKRADWRRHFLLAKACKRYTCCLLLLMTYHKIKAASGFFVRWLGDVTFSHYLVIHISNQVFALDITSYEFAFVAIYIHY